MPAAPNSQHCDAFFFPSPELSGPRSAGAPLSTPFVGPIVMSVCWDRGRNERAATPRWGGFAVQRPLDSARMNGGVNVIVMQRDSSSFALVKTERPHCPETELREKHCLRFRYFFSFKVSAIFPLCSEQMMAVNYFWDPALKEVFPEDHLPSFRIRGWRYFLPELRWVRKAVHSCRMKC